MARDETDKAGGRQQAIEYLGNVQVVHELGIQSVECSSGARNESGVATRYASEAAVIEAVRAFTGDPDERPDLDGFPAAEEPVCSRVGQDSECAVASQWLQAWGGHQPNAPAGAGGEVIRQ